MRDSNPRKMQESKSCALPLGESPINAGGEIRTLAPFTASRFSRPVPSSTWVHQHRLHQCYIIILFYTKKKEDPRKESSFLFFNLLICLLMHVETLQLHI